MPYSLSVYENYLLVRDISTNIVEPFPLRVRFKQESLHINLFFNEAQGQSVQYLISELLDENEDTWNSDQDLFNWLYTHTGKTNGGNSLTAEGLATLSHFIYNPTTDRLEADRSIQTILNSFELGDVHTVSSGGENIFFTNNSSDIDWYPMWGGIKDQSQLSNRGASGIIQPSARQYSSDVIEILQGVSADNSGFSLYESTDIIQVSASLFGIDTVVAENVLSTDYLHYEVYRGVNDSGLKAYEQSRTGVSTIVDDSTDWFFSHPFEAHENTQLYFRITKSQSQDGARSVLKVRPSTVTPSEYYVKVYLRTFKDVDLEFISPYLHYTSMDFSQDETGTNILFTDTNSSDSLSRFFINELKAIDNGLGGINVYIKDGVKVYIDALNVATTYIDGSLVTQTVALAVNELNALFSNTSNGTLLPVVTSSLAVSLTGGDSVNYTLTGDNGSEVIWDLSGVQGVTLRTGNNWNIVGGSELTAGTYNIPVILLNSNGQDSETVILTVSSPPYSNSKSTRFNKNDFLNASATTSNPLYRSANGSGSGDAWSVSVWFKGGASGNSEQTIFSFGGNDEDNEGSVWLKWDASGGNKNIKLRYGTDNNRLVLETPQDSFTKSVWRHILVTYDGGTTGQDQGQINDYFSRIKIFINGVQQSTTNTHNNDGWSGSIKDEFFRIGEASFGGKHLRNSCFVDEFSIWNSDQSSNVSQIYNTGSTHDLGLLSPQPSNYWRLGDDDTYPTLVDSIGSVNFTMNNMTSADIVTDVP